jgi:putative hydrolase of the HAD superfamily
LIRAVLFDATGTLLAPREPVGATYSRLARDQGVVLSAGQVGDAFRRAFARAGPIVFPDAAPEEVPALERDWWRRLVQETFLTADSTQRFSDFEAFFAKLWGHFASPDGWLLRPGSHELLVRLRARGLRTGVVSNFDRRLPRILAGLGLAAQLDAIVLPSDAGAAKPDRRIFALALERVRVAAAEALFVGDDAERDLEGARAAGLLAVDATALATLGDLRIPGDPEP